MGHGASAIDIHHHYIPSSLLEEAKRHGKALGVEIAVKGKQISLSFVGGPPHGLHPELSAVTERLQMMERAHLSCAVLEAHTATLGCRLTGEQGEIWSRLYNEGIKDLVSRYPDRFAGLASVPLQDPVRAARVLEHAVCELKLCGGYIGTNVNGRYYSSTEFDPFWQKAEELDALIVMHPEDVAGGERMDHYGLKLVCGNPAESALSLGYMIYSGVFDRMPNLKLCVLHGGGLFPYHLGRFDRGWDIPGGREEPKARTKPSAYLKNLYFDTLVHRVDALDYLRRLAGSEHIMVGTDYPFVGLGDWQAVEMVEALDCTDAEKLAILEGNARRLLHLGVPACKDV